MAHTFTNLLTHIVFSTKDRMPTLEPDLKQRLFPYMGGIFRELSAMPLLINGPTDHVHVLAALPAKLALAEIVGKVKSNSSGWVHKTFPMKMTFGWQTGYAAFGVSSSQRQTVLHYITQQEEHHRKISFKEEFLSLLKRHEIKYDEKYLWE